MELKFLLSTTDASLTKRFPMDIWGGLEKDLKREFDLFGDLLKSENFVRSMADALSEQASFKNS